MNLNVFDKLTYPGIVSFSGHQKEVFKSYLFFFEG